MDQRIAKLIATFFGVGLIPVAPGSFATAVGIGVAWVIKDSPATYLFILALLTILGFKASDVVEKTSQKKDPSCIVIDEVVGVLISFLFLPMHWSVICTGFFLFRAFDMFKIYPANKLELKAGGVGVMMDDILAGVYTNLVLQVAVRWSGLI